MTARFAPLPPDQLSPDALALYQAILDTRGAVAARAGLVAADGSLRGPFAPLLHTPATGDLLQRIGVSVRADATLSPAICAVVILTVAHELGCEFEWAAHSRLSVESGALAERDVRHIGDDRAPDAEDLEIAWRFASQECRIRMVDEATLDAAQNCFGERGIVELTLLVGYYTTVCMLIRNCAPTSDQASLS